MFEATNMEVETTPEVESTEPESSESTSEFMSGFMGDSETVEQEDIKEILRGLILYSHQKKNHYVHLIQKDGFCLKMYGNLM